MISAFVINERVQIVRKDGSIYDGGPVEYCGFFKLDKTKERNGLPAFVSGMSRYLRDGDYWKVYWSSWKDRKSWLDTHNSDEHYECDVSAIRRWISDHNEEIERPRRAYIDIETDSRVPIDNAINGHARVLCWALVLEDGTTYSAIIKQDSDSEEYRILTELWDILDRENIQQLCAWNGDGFDFPVLDLRRRRYNIERMRARYIHYMDHLECFRRGNIHAAESGEEKRSYKLEDICQTILGYGKKDVDGSKAYQYWRDQPELLLDYCIQDTRLLLDLEKKRPYLDLYYALARVCHTLPNSHSLKPTVYADGFMLKRAKRIGVRLPSKKDNPPHKFKGAFVLEPQRTGIIENVLVADFKGMYPSIMRSFNMSPETKCIDPECIRPHAVAPITEVKFHTDEEGMIPAALREIGELRVRYQKEKEEYRLGTPEYNHAALMADACKTALNSIYGISGSIYSRLYDTDVGESTSQGGVWLNKDIVIPEATKRGYFVIYGDTDSTYNLNVVHEEFAAFVKWINEECLPPLLTARGCKINTVKLNYDKVFHRIVFPTNKGKTVKKRYAGWYSKPGETETDVEIKGIEYKRGDSLRLAVRMQEQCIELLKTVNEPEPLVEFVKRWMFDILDGELNVSDITQTKSISRPLSEYKPQAMNTPHVRMARRIIDETGGLDGGNKVAYIVSDADVSPSEIIKPEEYENNADRRYLWCKKVFPPTMRLLEGAFPSVNWEQFLIKKHKKVPKEQLKLFK